MKKILLVAFSLFASSHLSAQDTKALLDSFSKALDSHKSLDIHYSLIVDDAVNKLSETKEGQVQLKGQSFKLVMEEIEVYSDGKTKWTVMDDVEEITIQDVDQESTSMLDNPLKFLSVGNKDLTASYKGTATEGGKTLHEVEFFPKDKKAAYSRVVLLFDKSTLYPYQVKYVGKDGVSYTVKVKSFTPNASVDDKQLTFNRSDYKDYELVDLR